MAESKQRGRRALVQTSTLSAGVLLVVALVLLLNYLGWKYHQRLDWTQEEIYTLSDRSRGVLDQLDREVQVIVFMGPESELYGRVTELLARYEAASPLVSVRVLDPERNLAEAQALVDQYQVTGLDVVIFDAGDEQRIVQASDLAEYDYSGLQMGQAPQLTGFKGEQQFTSTFLNLLESRKPKILFTTGHGEHSLDDFDSGGLSGAADYLERENFEIEEWASLGAAGVPPDTDLVVVAGPTTGFVEPEVAMLARYLASGGRLLVAVDPVLDRARGGLTTHGLDGLLAEYGITVDDTIVVDPANPLPFFGAETIFVASYGSHPITDPLRRDEISVILPLARSIRMGDGPAGWEAVELLTTSDEGWGETDLEVLQGVEKSDEDIPGPVSLAVAVAREAVDGSPATGPDDPTTVEASGESAGAEEAADDGGAQDDEKAAGTRLVVLGDSDLFTNSYVQQAGNSILFTNVFNWLVARESLLAIPAKEPQQVRLNLGSSELARIRWLSLAVLPGLVLGLGVWVWSRRRR
jgi:ABC-type uncharacterized transport system involved in gliding motility auxiliary subunit